MKLQSNTIYKYIVFVLGLQLIASSTSHADLTASLIKAQIDKYEGKRVTLSIPYVRAIPAGPEEKEGIRFLVAPTADEDNHSSGGHILIVASDSNYNSLIRKYGTTAEKKNHRIDFKDLRGTVRVLSYEDSHHKRDMIYLDTTSGTDLSDIVKHKLRDHIKHEGGGDMGGHGGGHKQHWQQKKDAMKQKQQQKHKGKKGL